MPSRRPAPGRPRIPATLAMPTSVPCRASRIAATNGWNVCTSAQNIGVEHGAERRQIIGDLGERAARHAGVRDHDVGHAEARDEIGGGALQRTGIAHIAGVGCRRAVRKARRERVELRLPPREEPEHRALRRVMPRERRADAGARAGQEHRAGTAHAAAARCVAAQRPRAGTVRTSVVRRAPWRSVR